MIATLGRHADRLAGPGRLNEPVPWHPTDDRAAHAAFARPDPTTWPEWDVVRRLLPPRLEGLDVADLGCGEGGLVRWAASQGAASVLGLDLADDLLTRAREAGEPDGVRYEAADLDQVTFVPRSLDLAVASLSLTYVRDLDRLLRVLRLALRPGGRLMATWEHPVTTAPGADAWLEHDGRPAWGLTAYADQGVRTEGGLVPGARRQHRTLGALLTTLVRAGLEIEQVAEWPEEMRAGAGESGDRPLILAVAARRPV